MYTREEKKQLIVLARRYIHMFLENKNIDYPETDNPKFLEKKGVFVTLNKKGELRGCIGYSSPIKPVIEAVIDNAISAATEDPRFKRVAFDELYELDIEISILSVPRKIDNYDEIVVGRDGIIVSKRYFKGLLLPQVPVEEKWDLHQYLSNGCMKAGLSEDEWKSGVNIETFQAIVFSEKELCTPTYINFK